MHREKWTFLLLSERGEDLRQLTLRTRTIQVALGVAVLLCISVFAVVAVIGFQTSQTVRTQLLEDENELLVGELAQMRDRVAGLQAEIDYLSEQDAELRVLAGLDRIDEEVLQVGVGGPGSPTLEEHPLFELREETGESAFAVTYDLNALERRSRLLRESLAEAADSLAAHRDLLQSTPSILPTTGFLSSGFSNARLHPIHNDELPHEGVDIAAPRGTPIMAAANGRVTFVGNRAGYGRVVEIDHGYGYTTLYGHTSVTLVSRGQEVERGEVIAQVGRTGIATSTHLHYEVRINERPVNPMNYVISDALP